ncbi:hypothetical protein LOD99_6105 [Oopsacas minuta]|uniref:pyridoxal 5'-phosphate synthase n=1 Tax=Oopsacas minuta TaxID=111878 RepID=A0AAV7JMM5_9METZ|nr:hypothetical protein LOD99_6105 [Oopsacas minuta]
MAENVIIQEGIPIVSDPLEQFKDWYINAKAHPEIISAESFCLSTSSLNGLPSSRMLLMAQLSKDGLSFLTGSRSQKGKDLKENPFASCCFFWEPVYQQVKIQGRVEISNELSDLFWDDVPRELQLSAATWTQGELVSTRQAFVEKRNELVEKFYNKPVPRPADNLAYTLKPTQFEFYQSNALKIPDLIQYKWDEEKKIWSAIRLGI